MVAPVPTQILRHPRRKLSCPTRRSGPNSRPVNLLQPLASPIAASLLYFQQLAASFPKTPGWRVPQHFFAGLPFLVSKGTHFVKGCQNTGAATTFRINTCKSVSKQTTLSSFRINTYEKHRGGPPSRPLLTAHCPLSQPCGRCARRLAGWSSVIWSEKVSEI